MKALHELTELQLELLDVLWRAGEATVTAVHAELGPRRELARKTVGTLLMRLEKQGVVRHRTEGREYVYRPAVSRRQVRRASLRNLLDSLFSGSVAGLVSHALREDEIAPGDIERIRALLEEADSVEAHAGDDADPRGTTDTAGGAER